MVTYIDAATLSIDDEYKIVRQTTV